MEKQEAPGATPPATTPWATTPSATTPSAATQRTDCFPGIPDAVSPAPPPPLHVPTRAIIRVGLIAWVIALAATLAIPALHTGEKSWWPWACVSGLVLGTIGYAYVARGRGNAADAE